MSGWIGKGGFAALAAAVLCWAGPQPVAAQPAAAMKERHDLMVRNGAHMKVIAAYLRAGEGSAADVAARARDMAAGAARMPALFPAGTSLDDAPGKTGAKPEIWRDWPGFLAASDTFGKLSFELALAAGTGDKEAVAAAMRSFARVGCGGCHRTFRQKMH